LTTAPHDEQNCSSEVRSRRVEAITRLLHAECGYLIALTYMFKLT